MKPIVAPAAAVLLAGAGVAALYQRQWLRLAGLCTGFFPTSSMAIHNWVYGNVFVLFSANAEHSAVLTMPPRDYLRAGHELLTLHFPGEYLGRSVQQIAHWLSGPAESYATIPLNALGVAILLYVVVRGSAFDPVATADWCLGTGATCRGAVLHRRDRALSFPDLAPHDAGCDGMDSAGGH